MNTEPAWIFTSWLGLWGSRLFPILCALCYGQAWFSIFLAGRAVHARLLGRTLRKPSGSRAILLTTGIAAALLGVMALAAHPHATDGPFCMQPIAWTGEVSPACSATPLEWVRAATAMMGAALAWVLFAAAEAAAGSSAWRRTLLGGLVAAALARALSSVGWNEPTLFQAGGLPPLLLAAWKNLWALPSLALGAGLMLYSSLRAPTATS